MLNSQAEDPLALLTVAEIAAKKVGTLFRQQWQQPRVIKSKGYRDLVTDTDYAAQHLIVDLIKQRFPEHGFLTEEEDPELPNNGPIIWIIDPLDGTTNFSRFIPSYCVSIAACAISPGVDLTAVNTTLTDGLDYQILAGVIYDPARDELYSAAVGSGAKLNGQELRVSEIDSLESAVIGLDWSHRRDLRQEMLDAVGQLAHQVHALRATGSASLALAWVAAGRLDVYCNLGVKAWDVAAAQLLIEEAGGTLSAPNGLPWRLNHPGCIASNGHLHQKFIEISGFGLR